MTPAGWRTPMSTNVHRKARSTASPKTLQLSGVDTPGSASAALTVVQKVSGPLRSWSGSVTGYLLGGTLLAEVGRPHLLAGAHLLRRAVHEGLAEVEDVDPLADREHQAHVVLHHEDPEVAVLHQADEQLGELGALGGVEARRRLVHEEEVRAPGQRPGQFHEAALAGRDLRRQPVVDGLQAGVADELVGDGLDLAADLAPAADDPELRQRVVADVGRLGGQLDVLPHRQRPEQLHALEGAADAEPGPAGRALVGDVLPVERDRALVGFLETAAHVEQRGLAGAVGPDEPGDAAAGCLHGDTAQSDETAEADHDPLGPQAGAVIRPRMAARHAAGFQPGAHTNDSPAS